MYKSPIKLRRNPKKNVCDEIRARWFNCIVIYKKTQPVKYRECSQHWVDFVNCTSKSK